MASAIPREITVEDDDEFDWEAAVREIDVACQSTMPTTSRVMESSHFSSPGNSEEDTISFPFSKGKKTCGASRQSTLDKYMGKANPNPQLENWDVGKPGEDRAEVEESLSCIDIDAEAAKTWIYPGKIVFAAPSRPLVMQQIEACHNIVGIPQEWTIDMTGQISPAKRACFWKSKRVFFVTPQVLEKDIQSGSCLVKYLVCLVIDEAHRALGNYSYSVAVRELMAVPVQLRILALTATPGSKQQTIQLIIDNLRISTLEYRNESDHDVIPYVHDRKIELIQVAMGQDAVEINNKLSEVIRPYVARLCSMGVLQNRDFQTLSPCDLLTSRDKFRLAPPPDLPHMKYQDVEGYFGLLITLYHIRKLLSSHGIRPAYEMLEEKLQQGFFARFMSKNEDICKAKLIMQKNLAHGAPSPKLSKMLEVLLDHFKIMDPQKSRVIIFSNFRGSVRDIMDALTNIGDVVRATAFIGQSSGKTLKGQSQKVQQAVLEKFRAGKYNVIVATSIGEEGLDIMEVDLVICFDANVSPLRMIQRMGRTGRKHDGRVIVLACEGSELKGYMRKQANSKTIRKHMRNGGINSFNFHSSPRMIPHIFRPEVKFVELSIEQFVRPGKKLKDDHAIQTSLLKGKLSVDQTKLIAKYFHSSSEATWRPSLIAFPHFQTCPSRIYRVMHSHRTGSLIDMMQRLQGQYFFGDNKASVVEEKLCKGDDLEGDDVEERNGSGMGINFNDVSKVELRRQALDYDISPSLKSKEEHSIPELGSLCESYDEVTVKTKIVERLIVSPKRSVGNENLPTVVPCDSDVEEEICVEKIHLEKDVFDEGDTSGKRLAFVEIKAPLMLADEFTNDAVETELSPRLSNLIRSGVVPESPISEGDGNKGRYNLVSYPVHLDSELVSKSYIPETNERATSDGGGCGKNDAGYPINNEIRTHTRVNNIAESEGACVSTSPFVQETETLLAGLENDNSSTDWGLVRGERSESVKKPRRLKRLRKVSECAETVNVKSIKGDSLLLKENHFRSFSYTSPLPKRNYKGKRKPLEDVRAFIEEEAEVSSEPAKTDDEEDDGDDNSCDSFIDDRICATAANTQAETNRVDMMAIYRRSLLSQSPGEMLPTYSLTSTSNSVPPLRITEEESSSGKTLCSLQTSQTRPINHSVAVHLQPSNTNFHSEAVSCKTGCLRGNERSTESRIGKLTFCGSGSVPTINLDQEFSKVAANEDMVNDDGFYESLDLDAVEAQATLLLRQKSEYPTQKTNPQLHQETPNLMSLPSFDLGI